MKIAAFMSLVAAALVAAAPPVRGAAKRSESPRPARPTYVRLADWASANRFTTRWLERNRTLQLSNRWARLVFNVDARRDTRRAQINGVNVWLALPLLYQNGRASISQIDLDETLSPVLSPPHGKNGRRVKTICLDPGHGGKDPGFQVRSHDEKDYTLLLAREVRDQLKRLGFEVILTRNSDTFVERTGRPALARKRGADLFVSLHFNAFPSSTSVNGVEVYCCTPAGATSTNAGGEGSTRLVTGNRNDERNMLLAYQVQRYLTRSLSMTDRGVKRARFDVLAAATMPAILVEGGFMSHPPEGRRIFDQAFRAKMARAVVEGIQAYQRATAP